MLALLLLLAAPPQPEVDSIIEGVQDFYAQAQDLRAQFSQSYYYKVYDRKQLSEGTVYFKKPGKMRWDYQKPSKKVFVSDGELLWVYEPEENQAFKQSLAKAQLPVALSFMSGQGKLKEAFNAKLLKSPNEQSYLLELIPKAHEGDYKALRLTVNRQSYQVLASTVIDPVGNSNHLTFKNLKTNLGLPNSGFQFVPPKGLRIIQEGGRSKRP